MPALSICDLNDNDAVSIRTAHSVYTFAVLNAKARYGEVSGGTLRVPRRGWLLCDSLDRGGHVEFRLEKHTILRTSMIASISIEPAQPQHGWTPSDGPVLFLESGGVR